MELYCGQIWRNEQGVQRKILDLVHTGFYPEDDPNDMGSFEEFQVHYEEGVLIGIGHGKHIAQDYQFEVWIEDTKAELVFSPKDQVSYREG